MDRIERTREIHRELMALWGITESYNLSISVMYPPADTYASVSSEEIMSGTERNIPLKRILSSDDDAYGAITVYGQRVV